jgi:hypothetical protein
VHKNSEGIDLRYWISDREVQLTVSSCSEVIEVMRHVWDARIVISKLKIGSAVKLSRTALANLETLPDEHASGYIATLLNRP